MSLRDQDALRGPADLPSREHLVSSAVLSATQGGVPQASVNEGMEDTDQHTIAFNGTSTLPTAPACIVVIHGEGFGQRVDIGAEPVIVGRSTDATLRLVSPSVSRRHCEIWREGDFYRIRDLGSTNATYIGGRAVQEATLTDGDQITIGESVLKFVSHTNVEAVYHAHVSRLMFRDRLTGLLGRQDFVAAAEKRIVVALAAESALSLVLIDIDGMAALQAEQGDEASATALTQVVGLLESGLEDGDIAARIGECQLAFLLGRDLAAAQDFVSALRRSMFDARTMRDEPPAPPVSLLAGVAQLEAGTRSLGELMKQIRLTATAA